MISKALIRAMKKQAVSKTHSLLITSYKSLFTRHEPDG